MNHQCKGRLAVLFFVFCTGYSIALINIGYVQLVKHTFFWQLGQKQYHIALTQTPERAVILDRTGKNLLADNKNSVAAFILPKQIEHKQELKQFLALHFPQCLERLEQAQESVHFLYVQRRLNQSMIDLIMRSNLPDIHFLQEPSRFYPLPAAACIIGITDIDNKGLFGLELQYDAQLAGIATTVSLEKDARSHNYYFQKQTHQTGIHGTSLQITIDSNLQFLVHQILEQHTKQYEALESAALVVDAESGEICAMVNYPSFDPEAFDGSLQGTKNSCLTEAYELGSVIKICTALAALEEQVVTCDELIDCKNSKTTFINGRKINTVKANGIIPFEQVIAQSNNIGIAQVAQRLGTKLYDHYLRLGFSKKTGLQFPGENKGFLNDPAHWSKQSIISLSYGYEVSANLAQLARVFCIIASDGKWVDLHLEKKQSLAKPNKQLYSSKAIQEIQSILEKTTKEGTAKKAQIQGYRVMCKTGTANLLENGIYNPQKNIFTCAGIIEKNGYKKVIVVFIKETAQKDLYAAQVAAPLFEKIAEITLINDRIL